nr:hypothetical protein Iba_chr02aCG9490 [Ipomoea batatas]
MALKMVLVFGDDTNKRRGGTLEALLIVTFPVGVATSSPGQWRGVGGAVDAVRLLALRTEIAMGCCFFFLGRRRWLAWLPGRAEATWIPRRCCCLSILSGDVAASPFFQAMLLPVANLVCRECGRGRRLLAFGIAIGGAARCGGVGLVCVFALSSPLGRRRPAPAHGDDAAGVGDVAIWNLGQWAAADQCWAFRWHRDEDGGGVTLFPSSSAPVLVRTQKTEQELTMSVTLGAHMCMCVCTWPAIYSHKLHPRPCLLLSSRNLDFGIAVVGDVKYVD